MPARGAVVPGSEWGWRLVATNKGRGAHGTTVKSEASKPVKLWPDQPQWNRKHSPTSADEVSVIRRAIHQIFAYIQLDCIS